LDENYIVDYCFDPIAMITQAVKEIHPHVGVIAFPRSIGTEIRNFSTWCNPDCVSLSDDVPLKYMIKHSVFDSIKHRHSVSLQGGINPNCLLSKSKEDIMRAVIPVLRQMENVPYVVNLSHGVNKETPTEHVRFLVDIVKRHRKFLKN